MKSQAKKQPQKRRKVCKDPTRTAIVNKLKSEVKLMKTQIKDLTVRLEQEKEKQDGYIITKECDSYTSTIRKCVYYALQHQCPVDHVSDIVQFVAEQVTGKTISYRCHHHQLSQEWPVKWEH